MLQKLQKALAYYQSGKLKNAEKLYRKIIKREPGNFDANHLLGIILYQTGRVESAKVFLLRALKINPDAENALNNMGLVFQALGKYTLAINHYRRAIKLNPEFVAAFYNLANTFQESDRFEESINTYRKTLLLAPNHYEAMNNLGNVLIAVGEIEEARQYFSHAVRVQPNSVGNLFSFAMKIQHKIVGKELQIMEELFNNDNLPEQERMLLAYGLGKAFDDLQEYSKAFAFTETANQIARKIHPYNHQQHLEFHQQLSKNFNQKFFDNNLGVHRNEFSPIFILGMPRSASSLVEHILASHPMVHAAGELTKMGILCHQIFVENNSQYPMQANLIKPEQWQQIADDYEVALMEKADMATFGIDKMPYNYHYLAMIAVVFPNAKFVHTRRDPLDTCLSIYQHYFTSGSHPYAHNLTDLGQYYRQYEQLMIYWHSMLPGRIYDIDYLELVENSEHEIKALLEFCDLTFDPICLNFHNNNRVVKTASAIQIREPINRRGLDRWKNYEDYLLPLKKALNH